MIEIAKENVSWAAVEAVMLIDKLFIYSVYNKLRRDFLLFLFRWRSPHADAESVFRHKFQNNLFGGSESLSGTGSSLAATATIRAKLPDVISDLGTKTLLDIPCGDFNWAKVLDLRGCQYTGADIVEELINQNQIKYGAFDKNFVVHDILRDRLPKVDLVLCRDLFVHFPNEDVFRALVAIKQSGSTYLITTSFAHQKRNQNINLGSWRPLNLTLPPFSLPPPLAVIPDEDLLKFRGKALCLWRVSDILDDNHDDE